ncbi:MAG TPA: glycosyltransferase family 9 protein [Pyrinomonadaceae bacterium]|nr:glycosyltransferase family 9 protein [Pyrinomonadaceae bacterium]
MGDQILALPALRYLASTLPATKLEARIGGWKLRQKLFRTLLAGCSLTVNSLEALQRQPRRRAASRSYDVIVDFDTRDPPYGAIPPSCIRAERAYFSFAVEPRIKKQVSLELYDNAGSAFWQRCFEMAFRAACLVKRQAYVSNEMLACRGQFRGISLTPPPVSTRRRINRLLNSSRANQRRLAITPGGYNPPWKRWPIERFADVIGQVLPKGVDIFVLGSPAESQLACQLEELVGARYSRRHKKAAGKLIFLNGRLEMEELPHLLQEMDLHLSNDNGVAHLGGILNRPQLILYRGLSSPHLSVGFNDVRLFSGDHSSMQAISTAAVIDTLEQMLTVRAK